MTPVGQVNLVVRADEFKTLALGELAHLSDALRLAIIRPDVEHLAHWPSSIVWSFTSWTSRGLPSFSSAAAACLRSASVMKLPKPDCCLLPVEAACGYRQNEFLPFWSAGPRLSPVKAKKDDTALCKLDPFARSTVLTGGSRGAFGFQIIPVSLIASDKCWNCAVGLRHHCIFLLRLLRLWRILPFGRFQRIADSPSPN